MTNGFRRQFQLLAAYNQWANARLLGVCAQLSDTEFQASRPAFFGSILGTLNHILVGDRSWLARLRGDPPPGYALDQIVCATLAALTEARAAEDQRIEDFGAGLAADGFGAIVDYKTIQGAAFENTVSDILTHMFNHQTHHRGQVHCLLSQTDVAPPELDLIFYLRETG